MYNLTWSPASWIAKEQGPSSKRLGDFSFSRQVESFSGLLATSSETPLDQRPFENQPRVPLPFGEGLVALVNKISGKPGASKGVKMKKALLGEGVPFCC